MPLVDFWMNAASRGVHPEDAAHLSPDACVAWSSAHEARLRAAELADRRNPIRRKLHVSLFPQPFVGSVRRASVCILFGNPGLSVTDYVDELDNEEYIQYCEANLRGAVDGFGPLMSAAIGTAAAAYWEPVFRTLVKELADELQVQNDHAKAWAVAQIATIEAVAYHSRSFPFHGFAALPSTRAAVDYVHSTLAPRAQRGECLILVWRQAKLWGLEPGPFVVQRAPRLAQGRYLHAVERQAMVRFLAARYRANQTALSSATGWSQAG